VIADWPLLNALVNCASQADLVAIHSGGGGYAGYMTSAGVTLIADGSEAADERLRLCLTNLLKLVIAVEADIDPEDWRQVEWSLAARFRGHEDLIVLPGVKADRCDPVQENSVITKIGMIATTRPGDGAVGSRSEFARPPLDVLERVQGELDQF
jgi:3-polyprenyl-4-hydroxybenzoate decarboxylase